MRHILSFSLLCVVSICGGLAADDLAKYEYWITGDVFERHGELMFRCSKPVKGNPAGNVVYLGSSRAIMNTMLPFLKRAAERHSKLRLYGVMLPVEAESGKSKKAPNAQFIVWKAHLPDEPDVLPPDQKVIMGPDDRIEGDTIIVKKKP